MRKTLLASATLLSLALSAPAFAQQATEQSASPPAGVAAPGGMTPSEADAPAAPDATQAPAPKKTHHRVAAKAEGESQWAHQPGTGESGPASSQASNIDAADTHSDIAPHFPSPKVGENAGPAAYLKAAEAALKQHRSGEADQALEMAETRLLDRSTPATDANQPDQSGMVQQVSQARQALAKKDYAGARRAIAMAMQSGQGVSQSGGGSAGAK
jgi:hypothetical protein